MKFSIITVNYNNRDGLLHTIESVINQTYGDYEFIIIDGGSTDGSLEIIKQYCSYITYWVSEPDKGIYNGMNKGIVQAKGTYINFMNSGDFFFENDTLEKIDRLMDNSDIIVGKDFHQNLKNGEHFVSIAPLRISMATFYMSTLPHQSAFIRRCLFHKAGYDETLHIVADWKFYLDKTVYENKTVQILDLIICNKEQDGISNSNAYKVIEERELVLSSILPPGIRKDYISLAMLDYHTLCKLLNMLDYDKTKKIISLFIKMLYRIYITFTPYIHNK
jgi:glycosyltransferase involved in cell wall biosynthesis